MCLNYSLHFVIIWAVAICNNFIALLWWTLDMIVFYDFDLRQDWHEKYFDM